jgi:DNA-binding CsgD family transcriptional regulator
MLLDRDADLAAIGHQLAAVRAGSGRVTVVEGPAGIGKSSLLATVAGFAEAAGMRVLKARGGPLEQDAAWGIVRQLFGPGGAGTATGAAALARRVLDPEAPEPALAGDAMHAAAHGLTWLASDLAEEAPLLLVVDDVHWADAPSLRWLVQLSRRLDELPLGALCAVRSGEPAGDPELLAELLDAAEPPVRPRPLGPDAAETLVRERLPQADAAFAHACHAVTGGNPFLLRALLGHLVAERVEPTGEVARGLSAFGPEQVARSVERRLARLPEGAAALARAFAVLGRTEPLRHAAKLAGLEPEAAAPLADALRAAGILEGDALAHPLVAGALYRSLPDGERALWHAHAARLLESEHADAERVAVHLLRTEPVADPATVATLRQAAARASARGAPESAASFLRRALAEPPLDPVVTAEVTGDLGQALAAHLHPEAPAMLRAAVERAASPEQRAELALRGARALGLGGHFGAAIELARPVLDEPGGAPPAMLARLEAEFVANAWLDAATMPEALERLRPSTLDLWRVNAAMAATLSGRAADAPALMASVLETDALEGEDDSLLGSVAAFVLVANDELEIALARCDAVIDIARPRGWLIALAHGAMMRAMALVRAGRPREAEPDARLAFEYKLPVTPAPAMLWALTFLVEALTELDELDAADAALAQAGQLGAPPRGAMAAPLLLQARGHLRLAQRRHAEAHTDLLAAGDRWDELGVTHPGVANWRVDAVEALEDAGTARALAQEHVELAGRLGLPAPRAAGLRALAATGDRIALLEEACSILADTPNRLEYTRALVDLGAALRRANRRNDARAPLRQALDLADRGGMRLLARRARDELHIAGARPRRTALSGVAALTPAEHRVALLAADGHTNREIAERLYVTQRTVETHLTHIFQKLDIAGRSELGMVRGEAVAASG